MNAMVYRRDGLADVLHMEDLPRPAPRDSAGTFAIQIAKSLGAVVTGVAQGQSDEARSRRSTEEPGEARAEKR